MRILIILLLFGGHLAAEEWEIVDLRTTGASEYDIRLELEIKNTSGRAILLKEDQLSKGNALANYFYTSPVGKQPVDGIVPFEMSHWMLFARPCHAPVSHLTVWPGEVVKVSVSELRQFVGTTVRFFLSGSKVDYNVGLFVIPEPKG